MKIRLAAGTMTLAALMMACGNSNDNTSHAPHTKSAADTTGTVHPDLMNEAPLFVDSDGKMAALYEEQGYVWSKELEDQARRGDIESLRKVACMFAYGIGGVKPNRTAAFFFYRELANRGDLEAQTITGYMMLYGIGPLEDTDAGLELLVNSANHDDPQAFYVLGNFYHYSIKNPDQKDRDNARLYYTRAVQLGHQLAQEELDLMAEGK